MNKKDLLLFLGLELFAIAWAGFVFSFFSSRLLAGGLAGGYFVLSAAYMLMRAWRWPERWTSPTFYMLIVQLFGISLPMVITRFLNAGQPFEDVHILGLEGPAFHKLSTSVFTCLLIGTLIDLARAGLRGRSPKKSS